MLAFRPSSRVTLSMLVVRTLLLFLLPAVGTGCMTAYKKSIGANQDQVAAKSYRTDFNEAWQATLDALKSVRLDVSNRDAGFLQTRWMDNTILKNFSDGDGTVLPYMKAKYRFKISVAPTLLNGKSVVKISVQKEQLVQKDALDESRHQESDLIEERTLLYRIGRIVSVKARLARAEKLKMEREMKAFGQNGLADPSAAPPSEPAINPEPGSPAETAPDESVDSGL